MDLQTAVAASMLPASREKVAAAFKELSQQADSGLAFLEFLWSACGRQDPLAAATARGLMDAAARALDEGQRLGIAAIPSFDPRYPALLLCTRDPPPVLWTRGRIDVLSRPAVAVIGSRAAPPYALQV